MNDKITRLAERIADNIECASQVKWTSESHRDDAVRNIAAGIESVMNEKMTLEQRIQGCLEAMNGRWDEYGDRAVDAYKWLVGERGTGNA